MDDQVEAHRSRLLAAVARGDVDAFEELYDIFERPVFSLALRVTHDRQRAEETVQDAFLKVWRHAGRYDAGKGVAGSWIFTIAKRAAIDLSRREQKAPAASELSDHEIAVADTSDELGAAWQVNLALASLPEEQSRVIDLFVISGFTHAEIAERLKLPLGTVKTRIYSGLKQLRRTMEPQESSGAER